MWALPGEPSKKESRAVCCHLEETDLYSSKTTHLLLTRHPDTRSYSPIRSCKEATVALVLETWFWILSAAVTGSAYTLTGQTVADIRKEGFFFWMDSQNMIQHKQQMRNPEVRPAHQAALLSATPDPCQMGSLQCP